MIQNGVCPSLVGDILKGSLDMSVWQENEASLPLFTCTKKHGLAVPKFYLDIKYGLPMSVGTKDVKHLFQASSLLSRNGLCSMNQ